MGIALCKWACYVSPVKDTQEQHMTTVAQSLNWTQALKEFPDFPVNDLPPLPEGFEDVSWHNDTCPSAYNAAERLAIFVDYADPERREFPENDGRFSLVRTDDDGATIDTIGSATDDWRSIELLVQVFKA
jgi:hypothetical protein